VKPRAYWLERYRAQGDRYVAAGGRAENVQPQIELIAPHLVTHLPAGGRVLDYGCGPGRFRPFMEAQNEYVGLDIIDELSDDWALLSGPFDFIAAIYVLQHITRDTDYYPAMRNLVDALACGGKLFVVDHIAMTNPAEHMSPRGPGPILDRTWAISSVAALDELHWLGVFTKAP